MVKPVLEELRARMDKTLGDLRRELAAIRTGRASVSLLDHVTVDYYGNPTPVNQVATLSVPEPSLIVIQPWDPSVVGNIEKALRLSDLGVNPSNDGKVIRVPIPPLTEERRKQLAKVVGKVAEDHRTAIRQIRRDGNERVKKLCKDKQISEDDEHKALDHIQKLTDQYIEQIDKIARSKEDEIMKV
ncbi:MAG: ribosome recycling factor [Acidobacteria bacterium]|nr:ribosome recycling factor [Acidobacteriota bacterium]